MRGHWPRARKVEGEEKRNASCDAGSGDALYHVDASLACPPESSELEGGYYYY